MAKKTTITYIDPMVDYAFKKIFRDSGKKELIIRPLNEFFGLDIVDINIRESEHLGQTREDRKASFDLFCTASDDRKILVEVQLARQKYFMERSLFYMTFPIAEAAPRDKRNQKLVELNWDYNYPPVFFLGLLNFDVRHLDPELGDPNQFIHLFSLRNEKTGELMTDRLRFAFLEIKRFNKPKEACVSFEDRFLFIMKNLSTFATKPELSWDDPYFDTLLEEAEYASMDRNQRRRYKNASKMRNDYYNTINYAVETAVEEAVEKKETETRQETARRMLAEDFDVETIARLTGLTEEQVRAL